MNTHFTFLSRPVDEETLPKLPEHLVLRDTRDGCLIVRRKTQIYVPVPPSIHRLGRVA